VLLERPRVAEVIVYPDVVERGGHALVVATMEAHGLQRNTVDEGIGITATQGRLQKPDIVEGIEALGGSGVLWRRSQRRCGRHAEGGADFGLGSDGFDGAKGVSLPEVDGMRGFEEKVEVLFTRCVHTTSVTEVGEDRGLVEDGPGLDAVAESLENDLGVVGEASGSVAIGPAALILKGLG
jgi:hypothetical protein